MIYDNNDDDARRRVADRRGDRTGVHARAAQRRAPADRADRRRVHRRRGAAGARTARAEGLGARARAGASRAATSACSAPTCPRRSAASSSTRSASIVVGEAVGRSASFATTFGAQTGLAITPLLCFGTEEQKQRYLPGLVSGEIIGAYALSESGSGSDALGAKARATRQPDGSFVLSGEKMWITNGGFADLFIVFAKVDGEQFTAFLVERAFPGVSTGQGRAQDGPPRLVDDAAAAAGRQGAGEQRARRDRQGPQGRVQRAELRPLQAGGDVQRRRPAGDRRGGAATRCSAGSSASRSRRSARSGTSSARWRSASTRSRRCSTGPPASSTGCCRAATPATRCSPALEEFAIEASILKVAASEMLDFVLDENVQIHGGNGFVRDYPAERHYRDARVNRIFEGTNEINRLLVPGMLAQAGGEGRPAAHRRGAEAPGRTADAVAGGAPRRRPARERAPHGWPR